MTETRPPEHGRHRAPEAPPVPFWHSDVTRALAWRRQAAETRLELRNRDRARPRGE